MTVQLELRGCGPGAYRAASAQAVADARARRPKEPKLVADAALAGAVQQHLGRRWSRQAISADLRALGMLVCAETIYRACYGDSPETGLEAEYWSKLPRQRQRRRRRGRCE